MKPRIYVSKGRGWCCFSGFYIGRGRSPAEAYEEWQWHRRVDLWCVLGIFVCVNGLLIGFLVR